MQNMHQPNKHCSSSTVELYSTYLTVLQLYWQKHITHVPVHDTL